MLRRLSSLKRCPVQTKEGAIGRITSFYFDDDTWAVKYAAVRTIEWPGSFVLLPSSTFVHPDRSIGALLTTARSDAIRTSPRSEEGRPISKVLEAACLSHFGLLPSWPSESDGASECSVRSINELIGSIVRAVDGGVGFLEDIIINAASWDIRYLVVDMGNAVLGGKSVAIPRSALCNSDWPHRRHCLTLSRHQMKAAPEASLTMSATDEQRLRRYFADGLT